MSAAASRIGATEYHDFSKASGTVDLVARNVVAGDGKARVRLKVTPDFSDLQEFLDREDQGVALPPLFIRFKSYYEQAGAIRPELLHAPRPETWIRPLAEAPAAASR